MSVLTVADIDTAVSAEPRIEDERLAVALGFERPREIRRLIERHNEGLSRFGEVCVTVTQTSVKGGRPGRAFWLNLRQALYLATKSEAENAVDLTVEMVDLFASVREGKRFSATATEAPTLPALDRANLAMLRIGGKVVLVDTRKFDVGPNDRVVRVHYDGRIDIGLVTTREDGRHGARGYLEKPRRWRKGEPLHTKRAIGISGVVQVLGLVVDEIPAGRPGLPKPKAERAARVDRSTFDAAAFVSDLNAVGCDVGVLTPVPVEGYAPGQPSYVIRSPERRGAGDGASSVLTRWSAAIAACPDHDVRVAAYLAAEARATKTLALTRH